MNLKDRVKISAKELVHGNFGNAFRSLISDRVISPSIYRGGEWFFGDNGIDYFFDYLGIESSLKAYEKCPPLTAIINRKAQAFTNGKIWILDSKGKESNSRIAKQLNILLQRPNPLQNWTQFEAQAYIYHQLFGFALILGIRPAGFPMTAATALWNIPPPMVNIQESQGIFYGNENPVSYIRLTYGGESTDLSLDDLLILKDYVPSFYTAIFPDSRVRALRMPINNIIGAYESRNVLINNRGALGILTNQSKDAASFIPLTPDEKEQIQKDFQRYGLRRNQWQFVITSKDLKWQSMSYPTKDLMLFEEIQQDTMQLCDTYNYPTYLLGISQSAKGTTFSNMEESKKTLYQDAIIPESLNFYEQINNFLGTANFGLKIDKDFSQIPTLQEDMLMLAQARLARNQALQIEYLNGLITKNRWLEINGEDPIPDGDQYYQANDQNQSDNE